MQIVFERRTDGSVAPRLSAAPPDGVKTFGLEDAVAAFKMPRESLLDLCDWFYGPIFPKLQDGELDKFAPPTVVTVRRELLKAVRWQHLNDFEIDATLDMCVGRRLDPWRHVFPDVRVNQAGKRDLKWIVTIDAIRWLADETGDYAGQTLPYYLDDAGSWHKAVWTDKSKPPVAARVGIRRRDFARPLWAVAQWEHYVQYVETPRGLEISDFWDRMAAPQLAKCAEVLGFRKAFPAATGGLLSVDEMMQASNPRRRVSAAAPQQRAGARPLPDITEETPISMREFEQVLADRFGLTEEGHRRAVIFKLRESVGGDHSPTSKTFFALAIRELEECPQLYGAATLVV